MSTVAHPGSAPAEPVTSVTLPDCSSLCMWSWSDHDKMWKLKYINYLCEKHRPLMEAYKQAHGLRSGL